MKLTETLNAIQPRTIAAACVCLSCIFVNLVGFPGLWMPAYVSQRASDVQLLKDWQAFTVGMDEDELREARQESYNHWKFTSVRKAHYHGWPLPYLFRAEMLFVTPTSGRTATPWPLDGAPILQFRSFALLFNLVVALLLVAATYFGFHAPRHLLQFRVSTLLCLTFAIALTLVSWSGRHLFYVSWTPGYHARFWYYEWLGVLAYRLGQVGIFLAFLCLATLVMKLLAKVFVHHESK